MAGVPIEPQASSMNITKSDLECMLFDKAMEPTALPLSLLTEITNGFSHELEIGSGGFAVVYKAMLDNSVVAVKRLSHTYMYEKEFHREVECLLKVKHKNIVRFLGYCADTQGNMAWYDEKLVMADVQQRLLCFEYLCKGSLERYITDPSDPEGLEWRYRYQIIKGICEGLNYLHQKNIAHLDLKPGNILLDEEMMPKITDFGLSRCFDVAQTHVSTKKVGGTLGYLAPEYTNDKITLQFDLYSLGVIIKELLTGKKGYQTVENVLESWSYTTLDTLQLEQIRLCAKIGIECTEADPSKRPACMKHIIDRLAETESTQTNPVDGPSKLLVLQQSVLCFPFKPNKIIACPLQLTNSTDNHVVFRLTDKSMESYLRLPLYGLVPPNTTYTLMVTTLEKEEQPGKHFIDVILHSATSITRDEHLYRNPYGYNTDVFFEEMGNAVQEVKLKALYTYPRYNAASLSKSISPTVKTIWKVTDERGPSYSLDTNQAKQWIMIGKNNGDVGFWDYSQRKVGSLQIPSERVSCVTFIERMQWIVVGTKDGYVHVYSCETKMQRIHGFRVVSDDTDELLVSLCCLAIHPTQPYLLSAGTETALWDWDKGWECVQRFVSPGDLEFIYGVATNHNDTFATASTYKTHENSIYFAKIWSYDSPKPTCTLSGHSKKVKCMAFFTCNDQEFLVTGSADHTAKIWDSQKTVCVYTLEDFLSPVLSVLYQPNFQTLIVGTQDGAIYLWSTTNYRTYSDPPVTLTRIINIGCVGAVYHLACAMGSIVIGKGNTVAIMDIDNVNYKEQSTDYNKQNSRANTIQHDRDTTSKEIAGSIRMLPILNVHPLELHFPYHPNEPISCSFDLTNNTDEKVAFRLVDMGGKSPWCFTKLPLHGIVPQRSTYTLIVTTKEEMKLRKKKDFNLIIQSSLLEDKYSIEFQNQSESEQFFEEAKELGNMVHEVILKPVYLQYEDITSENTFVKYNSDDLRSIDAHPTEPWILTGHRSGYACVWNHEIKYPMNSFKVSDGEVSIVKFIARKQWIVAETARYLHVYDCACVTKIEKIKSVGPARYWDYPTLAVHPTLPHLLSKSSYDYETLLLDWDQDWVAKQNFETFEIGTVAFNPWDHNCFAGFRHDEVQVWELHRGKPQYSLLGHHGDVTCVDFSRHGDHTYLVSGSKEHIIYEHNMASFKSWCSADFRLKRTFNLGGGGPVVGLACLTGSPRIVIGQKRAISTIEIPDDEAMWPDPRV